MHLLTAVAVLLTPTWSSAAIQIAQPQGAQPIDLRLLEDQLDPADRIDPSSLPPLVLTGDFDGNGSTDLYLRDKTGRELLLLDDNGRVRVVRGGSWRGSLLARSQPDRDGQTEVLLKTTSGHYYLFQTFPGGGLQPIILGLWGGRLRFATWPPPSTPPPPPPPCTPPPQPPPPPSGLITNGGFEQPVVPSVNTTIESGSGALTGWQISGTSGIDLGTCRFWQPAEGNQSISLNWTTPSTISQTVSTISGHSYLLTFSLAADQPSNPLSSGIKTMDVRWNGALVASVSFDSAGHTDTNMGWTPYQFFVVGTGSDQLSFVSTTTTPPNFGPALDAIGLN